MASKTTIANKALYKIGEPRVSNIEVDISERARIMNEIFDSERDSLLQKYPWNFALKRAQLAPTTPPVFGYRYAYQQPSDYLNIFSIEGDPDYAVVGSVIETDAGQVLNILYQSQLTTTEKFTPLFIEVLSNKLAFESVERITGSSAKKDQLWAQFVNSINDAYINDAIQGTVDMFPESDWITARN